MHFRGPLWMSDLMAGKNGWIAVAQMLAGFVASLSGNGKRVKMVKRHQRHAAQLAAEAAALAAAAPPTEEGELDGSGAVGQPMSEGWAGLVPLLERCRRHPRYPTNYALPSSERGWKRIQRSAAPPPGPVSLPVVLASLASYRHTSA